MLAMQIYSRVILLGYIAVHGTINLTFLGRAERSTVRRIVHLGWCLRANHELHNSMLRSLYVVAIIVGALEMRTNIAMKSPLYT